MITEITQITQAFNNNGRMHLFAPVNKKPRQIMKEYDEDAKKHGQLFLASMYNIICVNDIVIGLISDAFSIVKKSQLYRNNIKKKMNQVEKMIKAYEKDVNKVVGDRSESYANANDAFYTSELADSIERLRLIFKNEIDKHKEENSNSLSWLEITRVMLEYAVISKAKREEQLNMATHRGCKYFTFLDLSRIHTTYNQIYQYIYLKKQINLNTEQAKAMFRQIDKMCVNKERLENTIDQMSNEIEEES